MVNCKLKNRNQTMHSMATVAWSLLCKTLTHTNRSILTGSPKNEILRREMYRTKKMQLALFSLLLLILFLLFVCFFCYCLCCYCDCCGLSYSYCHPCCRFFAVSAAVVLPVASVCVFLSVPLLHAAPDEATPEREFFCLIISGRCMTLS